MSKFKAWEFQLLGGKKSRARLKLSMNGKRVFCFFGSILLQRHSHHRYRN